MGKFFTIFFLFIFVSVRAGENLSRSEFTILKYTELKFLSDPKVVNYSLDPVMIEEFKEKSKQEIQNASYDKVVMNEVLVYYFSQTDQWQRATENIRFVLIDRLLNYSSQYSEVKLFEMDEKLFQILIIDLLKKELRNYAKLKADTLNLSDDNARKAEPDLNFTIEELDAYFLKLKGELVITETDNQLYSGWIKKYNR